MTNDPIIIFDGSCNLCSWSVQFIIDHDSEGIYKFVPLQSNLGKSLISKMDISIHYLDSVLLIENSSYLMKSDAMIRISQQLQGRWSYLSHLSIIPKPIRDAVYDLVAKNRLKWFGQRAACTLPVYEVKDRFPE